MRAQVLNGRGKLVFPPAIEPLGPVSCPGGGITLRPGGIIRARPFIVARASWVQVAVTVLDKQGHAHIVVGQPVELHLGPPDPPQITLRHGRYGPIAVVHPVRGVKGRLYVEDTARCRDPSGNPEFVANLQWLTPLRTSLVPACYGTMLHWRLAAGYRVHSIRVIDYNAEGEGGASTGRAVQRR